jgi:hypothetical protein
MRGASPQGNKAAAAARKYKATTKATPPPCIPKIGTQIYSTTLHKPHDRSTPVAVLTLRWMTCAESERVHL